MKTSLPVVAALVAVVGLSTPVLAESLAGSESSDDFNAQQVLQVLRDRGVEATDVQEWGAKIRATVTLADGSSTFQYFDADTLRPVGEAAANTRVLSRLDTGAKPVAPSNNSLTYVDPDDAGY
jgi:hypothetical protein